MNFEKWIDSKMGNGFHEYAWAMIYPWIIVGLFSLVMLGILLPWIIKIL